MALEDVLENIYFTIIYDYLKKRGVIIEKFLKFVELLKKEEIGISFVIRPEFSNLELSENADRFTKGIFYIKNPKTWKNRINIFIGYEENSKDSSYNYYIIIATRSLSKTKKENRGLKILSDGSILFFIVKDDTKKTKNIQNDFYLQISTIEDRNVTYLKAEEIVIRGLDDRMEKYVVGSCNSNEIEKCNTKIVDPAALTLDNIKSIREALLKFANLTLNRGKDIIFDKETYESLDNLLNLIENISKKTKNGIPTVRIFYLSLKPEIALLRNLYLKSLSSSEKYTTHVM